MNPKPRRPRGEKWQKKRLRVLVRDNFRCKFDGGCKERRIKKLTVHHKTPLSAGGDSRLRNLLTLCLAHHVQLHREWQKQQQAN